MARETGQSNQGRIITFHEEELKVCDLCGWLNLAANTECFVCGWHGHFETEPKLVRAALELANRRYGKLELHHLTNVRNLATPTVAPFRMRVHQWLSRFRSRFQR